MSLESLFALASLLLPLVCLIVGWRVYRRTGSRWARFFPWAFGLGSVGNLLAFTLGLAASRLTDDPARLHGIAETTATTQRIDLLAMWLVAVAGGLGWPNGSARGSAARRPRAFLRALEPAPVARRRGCRASYPRSSNASSASASATASGNGSA
jgi:hypothetical protein